MNKEVWQLGCLVPEWNFAKLDVEKGRHTEMGARKPTSSQQDRAHDADI
jgi:hypothetical protein